MSMPAFREISLPRHATRAVARYTGGLQVLRLLLDPRRHTLHSTGQAGRSDAGL